MSTLMVDETLIQIPIGTPLEEAEHRLITATISHCGGDKRRAAELLGVCHKTIYNRLRKYRAEHGEQSR